MTAVFLVALLLGAAPDAGAPVTARPPTHNGVPVLPAVHGVVYHGPRSAKRVALTFDACSVRNDDHVDQGVLDVLIKQQVPATLMLGGLWMEDDADVVAQLKANPLFELQSHCYLHPHLTKLSNAAIQSEVDKSQADFERFVGHKATLLRPPYGEVDARVATVLLKNGITPLEFDLPAGDPDKHFTKKVLVPWVVNHVQPGGIVVMHMNGRGWHTAEALPDIVDGLRKRGFELVKVSELLATPAPPSPDGGAR